jgi:hypothetical protein
VVCVCVFEGEKGRERESERLNRDDRREMHMNSDCTWTSAEGRKAETDRQRGKIGEGSGQGRQIRKREGEKKTLCVPSSGCAECRRIMALSCRVWAEKSSTNA